jgi:formylmethanofuran dehydrogenase subunit A
LSQESKVDGGVQNQRCPLLSLSTPLMTSMLAMGRRGRRCGWVTSVHFSQTCDEDAPQLITHVETAQAPISDEGALSMIHADLAEKKLLPDQHLVDAGYVTIANLVKTQSSYGVDLVGPTLKTHWYPIWGIPFACLQCEVGL